MSHTIAMLEVTSRKTPRGIVIEAVGELDLMTTATLQERLQKGIHATINAAVAAPLAVDLRRVGFIDSAGLALLVAAQKRLAPAQCSLTVLLTPGQQPERVLKMGRFDTVMALTCHGSEPPPAG